MLTEHWVRLWRDNGTWIGRTPSQQIAFKVLASHLPVRERDDGGLCRKCVSTVPIRVTRRFTLTIIDVIVLEMRILRVIDNQSTAQAITVLVLEMAVVPEGPLQDTTNEAPESVDSESLTAWLNASNS